MKLLVVDQISKSFGGLRALANVSCELDRGVTLGLMGANGAGKTTLFSILAGNARADNGDVHFKGRLISRLRPDQICKLGIVRTFQIVRPFAGLTVRENVETALLFGSYISLSHAKLRDHADEILNEIGLKHCADQPAGTLTLSDRKRLEIARALGTEPELMLLDEVMAGLVPSEVAEMIDVIAQVKARRNLSLIVVEHVSQALLALSDRILVLHHGEVIAEGEPARVTTLPAVRAVYFGEEA